MTAKILFGDLLSLSLSLSLSLFFSGPPKISLEMLNGPPASPHDATNPTTVKCFIKNLFLSI